MLLLIFNIVKSCWEIRIANCGIKFSFAPQVTLWVSQAHFWSISKEKISRLAFEDLKCIFDAHFRRQSRNQMHVVRHDFDLDYFYAMAAGRLADASFRKIFMVELAKYFIAELCAPYDVPK